MFGPRRQAYIQQAGQSGSISSSTLAGYLGSDDPSLGKRNFGLLLLFEMLPDGYTSACCSGNPYPPKLNINRLCYS